MRPKWLPRVPTGGESIVPPYFNMHITVRARRQHGAGTKRSSPVHREAILPPQSFRRTATRVYSRNGKRRARRTRSYACSARRDFYLPTTRSRRGAYGCRSRYIRTYPNATVIVTPSTPLLGRPISSIRDRSTLRLPPRGISAAELLR